MLHTKVKKRGIRSDATAFSRADASKSASAVFSSHKYSHPMETTPYFSSVYDPRVVGRCKHRLSDILMVALITYLCGGEDYSDMYQLCRFRGKEFKPLPELPNGCPSEDIPLSASCKPCIPMRSPLISKSIPRRSSRIYRACTLP